MAIISWGKVDRMDPQIQVSVHSWRFTHIQFCSYSPSFAHPIFFQGGKQQLEEVWEEEDGLDPEDFDPKTFFFMHGMLSTAGTGLTSCMTL